MLNSPPRTGKVREPYKPVVRQYLAYKSVRREGRLLRERIGLFG